MELKLQAASAEKSSKQNSHSTFRSLLIIVLLGGIFSLLIGAGGYYIGYQIGKKEGARATVASVTDLLNPLKAISDNAAFPYTAIGKVSSVSKDKLTVKLPDGTEKSMALNDKTTVSNGTKILGVSDIKKDANVTAFTTGKGKDLIATRVVIR